ncbi:MAG: PLP-dependent aminotransferase family protein [Acidobacteria bacterium]|nr:PLP-dependent aminotransferase family protein [Acidobacteriota bacterium]
MSWTPRLRGAQPVYLALATSIADDIQAGRLAPGDRLPPQRDLADALGVTVTTVTRGYAEAARRGLVSGEVGRGTYIRQPAFAPAHRHRDAGLLDLSVNTVLPHAHAREISAHIAASASRGDAERLLNYQPCTGQSEHRAAGVVWLAAAGLACEADEIIVTAGAQHALAVTLMALAVPGDVVLAESLTYPGMTSLASHLHLEMRGVAIDQHGIVPDALDAAARRSGARVVYAMPSIQNPTGTVMPRARRQALVDVVTRLDLTLIEDDTYGFLVPGLTPLAAAIPDRTVYVASLSKSLAPGLRLGFLRAPSRWINRLTGALYATMITATPLMATAAAEMIGDGTAARVLQWKRQEIRARQRIARRIFKTDPARAVAMSPHIWIELGAKWAADDLATELRRRGILITPAREFAVVRRDAPEAVRICLGAAPDRQVLERALKIVAETIASGPRALGRAI